MVGGSTAGAHRAEIFPCTIASNLKTPRVLLSGRPGSPVKVGSTAVGGTMQAQPRTLYRS